MTAPTKRMASKSSSTSDPLIKPLKVHSLFIFAQDGTLMFEHTLSKSAHHPKLLFGMLYSLKEFVQTMAPIRTKNESDPNFESRFPKNLFECLTTPSYKLHCYETLTGLRFVLVTDFHSSFFPDKSIGAQHYSSNSLPNSASEFLHECYKLYVYSCINNPFYELNSPISTASQFAKQIETMFEAVNKIKVPD